VPLFAAAILGHAHPTIVRGTQRLHDIKATHPALRAALEGSAESPGSQSAAREYGDDRPRLGGLQ
jgi:hypothetical protein